MVKDAEIRRVTNRKVCSREKAKSMFGQSFAEGERKKSEYSIMQSCIIRLDQMCHSWIPSPISTETRDKDDIILEMCVEECLEFVPVTYTGELQGF